MPELEKLEALRLRLIKDFDYIIATSSLRSRWRTAELTGTSPDWLLMVANRFPVLTIRIILLLSWSIPLCACFLPLLLSIVCVFTNWMWRVRHICPFAWGRVHAPPPAMNIPRGHCVKLLKSLYGLKQSPRNWNTHLHEFIQLIGLRRSQLDHCMYMGVIESHIVLIAVFVDDILLASTCEDVTVYVKSLLHAQFCIN